MTGQCFVVSFMYDGIVAVQPVINDKYFGNPPLLPSTQAFFELYSAKWIGRYFEGLFKTTTTTNKKAWRGNVSLNRFEITKVVGQ